MIAEPLTELLDLEFLGRVIGREVREGTAIPLKQDGAPTVVLRVALTTVNDERLSLIVKQVDKDWPGDPQGHLREVHFYRHIAPRLSVDVPRVHFAGPEPGSERQLIVLADYGGTHRFLPANHAWNMEELAPALRAHARLHAGSSQFELTAAESSLLIPRLEDRVHETADCLPEMVIQLRDLGLVPELPAFERALARFLDGMPAYEELPASLLHLDCTPGNVGLPLDPAGRAIIVDWEMASRGLPEVDLAYLFFQPYGNARHLQPETVIARYWSYYDEMGWAAPPAEEQRERFRYAQKLWALWLIPAARRVSLEPFAPGSAPARHWEGLFPLLGRRLADFV